MICLMGSPSTPGLKCFVKLSLRGWEGVGDPMEGRAFIYFIPAGLPWRAADAMGSPGQDQQFEK